MVKGKADSSLSRAERMLLAKLGQRIRTIREKKDLSVYDVTGNDLPIKFRQHWQAIEGGRKNISMTTLFKIAITLEVSVELIVRELGI
jgi:transcriptional regulator with XRE-family HTH domain